MKSNISYSIVREIDTLVLEQMYREAGWWHEAQSERNNLPSLVRNSFCFIVARNGEDQLVGMGRVISDGVSDAYIQDVYVKENYRKMGIGKQLILRLKDQCLQGGISWIGLIANPGTAGFYSGLGFSEMVDYTPILLPVK